MKVTVGVAAALCLSTVVAHADSAKRIGMTLEMATVKRSDIRGAHLGMTIGAAWFGAPVTPWVEVGTFNKRDDEIFGTFAPPVQSWNSISPRLNLFTHEMPSVQELSAGLLLRWPTDVGPRPFFRCGVGYYLDKILEYEFPPLPGGGGSPSIPNVSSHRQWQTGLTLGLGLQGEFKNSSISPVVEFRWQLTRLYETSKSSLISAHAGLWLRP